VIRDRGLAWDGCANVRDLGGHATPAGETRFHAVVRSDSVARLTESGWSALVDYGVRTIVDLRYDAEVEADPPRGIGVRVVRVPLVPDQEHPDWREIDAIGRAARNEEEAQAAVYLELLERYRSAFAEAVRAVADASDGVVLVHCEGGKDRTGLIAALLLRLAGVDPDAVAADYAVSSENLREEIERWIAEAPDDDERALRARIGTTRAGTMLRVLAELDRRHGGVAGYLAAAGLGEEDVARARARLVS
jgi:protein tyrosine/serine phosphatase